MKAAIEFFVKQSLFANLLTLFILVIGVVSLFLIRREVFPNVTYDIITVATIFPGASPQEVERLVTNPIESELREVDGIKRIESHSVDGVSRIVLWLDPDQTTEEDAKSDIRDLVDRVKPDLPEEAEEPLISSLETKQQPIIEVSVAGELPALELRQIAKRLEDEIENIHGVARVAPVGLRDLEIRVETGEEKLSRYQVSLEDVITALRLQNVSIPGGVIKPDPTSKEPERMVRTSEQFVGQEDVRETVVRANDLGTAIKVSDIANVKETLEDPKEIIHTNGNPAIRLTVLKKEKSDAIRVVDDVKALIEEIRPTLDKRVQIAYVNDTSALIRRRLNILTGNLAVGLVLVLLMLSLLLPTRIAIIVSLGIPFSFFGAMILFNTWGSSINLISLIGLIIVSGMLVDDAIVVTDNCVQKIEAGMPAQQAAILGAYELWIPVTASVMTTVVVFLPMMFMSGLFGKFVREIPTGVVLCLLISLLEAFFILPSHIAKWSKKSPAKAKPGEETGAPRPGRFSRFWENKVMPSYLRAVKFNIRHRYLTLTGVVLLVIGTVMYAAFGMRFVLFPSEDIEIFMIRTQSSTGSSLEQTERLVRPIEDIVRTLPKEDLDNFITTVGVQMDGPQVSRRGSEYAQVTIFLTPPNKRDRGDAEIIEDLRKKIAKPEGLSAITFERVQGGPPVGKPVDISVRAKEYEQILPAAKAVKELLLATKGVTDIEDSYVLGKEEIRVHVDGTEAAAARLTTSQVGMAVRGSYEGIVATTLRSLDEEVDVRVSFSEDARRSAATLGTLKVPNASQNLIPLSRISELKKSQGLAEYEHEDFEREIEVRAAVDQTNITAQKANAIIKSKIPELKKQFPGVTFAFGGEDQDTQESMASLGRAFIVALLGVFLILVLSFRNLVQPILVFCTIPVGASAVIWAFALHGKPLTFMGMLGVVALAGVIVNNAIVFTDFYNVRLKGGATSDEAIMDSARTRLRPIFLTTMTTVVGLMPTTYGIGGLDRFVVYITMGLGWGMLLGSLVSVLCYPAALAVAHDISSWFARKFPRMSELS